MSKRKSSKGKIRCQNLQTSKAWQIYFLKQNVLLTSAYALIDAIERDDSTKAVSHCTSIQAIASSLGETSISYWSQSLLDTLTSQTLKNFSVAMAISQLAYEIESRFVL